MHKIDSDGATITNEFTEGNPSLVIPATVVSAAWLNAVQKEVVKVVESLGFTLLTSGTDTGDQMYNSILELLKRGGRAAPIVQAIANNQAAPADVVGFPQFDTTTVKAVECLFDIFRRTGTQHVKETGRLYLTWNSETSVWEISMMSVHDDSNVDFVATLVSGTNFKLQYTSDDLTGASYAGTVRLTDVKFVRVA